MRVEGCALNRVLLAMAGLAIACAPAMAQNALGDGRGLEANPRQGSAGRNYQRPSLEKEVQFRNAIATGNAPGGLSFRGDLGYQAPGEFSGSLGSDALYGFRRDSLYSGLAGMGIRGTDALQYQFSMTTGAQMTRNLIGTGSVSRLDGFSSSSLPGGFNEPGQSVAIDPVAQLRQSTNAVSGTLRSTSSYSSTSGLMPELVSVYERGIERDQYGLVATPLMGLVSTPMQSERPTRSGSAMQEPIKTSYADVIKEIQERATRIREQRIEAEGMDTGTTPNSGPNSTPNSGTGQPGPGTPGMGTPDSGTDGGQDAAADQEAATNAWIAERFGQLQRQVLGLPSNDGGSTPADAAATTGDGVNAGGVKVRDPLNPYEEGEGIKGGVIEQGVSQIEFSPDGQGLVGNPKFTIDPDTLEIIRGDGKRVTYLVDPTAADRDLFAEHMVAGERLLAAGRYFDAEERFTHALSARRGNVLAQLGRLHAQIGAGLVISASVNLQQLMSEHLEIVSKRYSGDLLPDEQRVRELILTLRERAGLDQRPDFVYVPEERPEVRVACGLLIAYLGFQIDDEAQMNAGFSVIREIGTDLDLRLVQLLSTVWGAVMDDPDSQRLDQGDASP